MSAAPLKPNCRNALCRDFAEHFRAHMSAAPLKPIIAGGTRTPWTAYFRAHMSAAPLKPRWRESAPALPLEFPRSHERGPIEAFVPRNHLSVNGHFRAHMSAAPLK